MAKHIQELPKQIQDSLGRAKKVKIPAEYKKIKNVCFVGMGGSATAADILIHQPLGDIKIPISLVRQSELPGWINKDSLVIFISHSGATRETLEAFKDAASREAKIIIIAEQGKLEELGEMENALVFDYDTQAPSRAALGYQFGFLIHLVNKLEFLPAIDFKPTFNLLEKLNKELEPKKDTPENMAKHLAFSSFDHAPIFLASGILKPVARRWKNQFNENAKTYASFDYLPEAIHNSIQGTSLPVRGKDDNIYFLLKNSFDSSRTSSQFDIFQNILDEKKISYETIEAQGNDIWQQKFSLILLGDWVSYYLAILNAIDPTPVEIIDKAKEKLK